MQKKEDKQTQGITLIALVVTIVVLLILASVSITVLFGDSGIITMAQKAAKETQDAADKDREDLAKLDEYLTSGNWGGTSKPTDPEEPDNSPVIEYDSNNPTKGVKVLEQTDGKTNVEWKETIREEENETILIAKIPVGFSVVKDVGTDINNINNGLVISDAADDDLENTAGGNQFVWIPVDTTNNMSNFTRIEGFSNGVRESVMVSCKEAGKEDDTIQSSESIAMYRSVAENGGFYIARFEAGIDGMKTPLTYDEEGNKPSNVPTPDGVEKKPISKKGVSPWNFITWGGTSAKEASDGLQGNDNANGAVKVARSMYTKNTNCGVTSTLCYGVQWDAVMQFIEHEYKNVPVQAEKEPVPSDSFVRNSSNKGNYEGGLALTGSNPTYQQKHIYDLAGNAHEWTMEAYDDNQRICRGASYSDNGYNGSASSRRVGIPDSGEFQDDISFRTALYL